MEIFVVKNEWLEDNEYEGYYVRNVDTVRLFETYEKAEEFCKKFGELDSNNEYKVTDKEHDFIEDEDDLDIVYNSDSFIKESRLYIDRQKIY